MDSGGSLIDRAPFKNGVLETGMVCTNAREYMFEFDGASDNPECFPTLRMSCNALVDQLCLNKLMLRSRVVKDVKVRESLYLDETDRCVGRLSDRELGQRSKEISANTNSFQLQSADPIYFATVQYSGREVSHSINAV